MKNQKRFYELILNCPCYQPLDSCVFEKYRRMPLNQLIEICSEMTSEEMEELVNSHNSYFSERAWHKAAI